MQSLSDKKDIVIVDLDGTLALDDHRNHLLRGENAANKKWDEYFALCGEDTPNWPILQLVKILQHQAKKKIYILTGRIDSHRETTENWLHTHSVVYDYLQMRRADSRTDDNVLKVQWVDALGIRDRVWLVLEDRARVVKAWRANGFACLQVREGDF